MLSITKYLYEGKVMDFLIKHVPPAKNTTPAPAENASDAASTATATAPKVVGAGIKKLVGETNYGRKILGNLSKVDQLKQATE